MESQKRQRNEFFAMGLPADESAVDLTIKAELGAAVAKFLQEQAMSQNEAADKYGVPQPVISKITTGNLDRLSVSYLWKLLFRMKQPVQVKTGVHPDDTVVTVGERVELFGASNLYVLSAPILGNSANAATVAGKPERLPPHRADLPERRRRENG